MTHTEQHPDADLRELVEQNPGQGTFEEYRLLRTRLRERAPAKVLIFGTGRDSRYWIEANAGGRTVFLEHESEWIGIAREKTPGIEIIQVSYDTKLTQWKKLLERRYRLFMYGLPDWILAEDWDVIHVDSPQGGSRKRPGRMQSIYTASVLARRSTDVDVFVHDCDRPAEATYADRYLGAERLVEQAGSMRWYRLRPPLD